MGEPAVSNDTRESSVITDHPFVPAGAWWTRCKHCKLAESAHRETTLTR